MLERLISIQQGVMSVSLTVPSIVASVSKDSINVILKTARLRERGMIC